MAKHIFVRPVRADDAQKFAEWSLATPQNLFDASVPNYPTTFTLCAYDKTGPLVYVPVQQPYMMEALAIRPNADAVDVAVALKELTQALVTQGHIKGVGEVYFLCAEETTQRLAERQAFEKLPYALYRLKLADLESGKP